MPPTAQRKPVEVRARGDQVVVRILSSEGKSEGGIILPDADPLKNRGTVLAEIVAVGDGVWLPNGVKVPIDLVVGDIVSLKLGHCAEIRVGSTTYYVLSNHAVPVVYRHSDGTSIRIEELTNRS